ANAVRHARATHVAVDLDCGPEHCVLRVTDDGIGGAAIGDGAGTGLLGIRDRLDAIGGRLDIDSRAGRGTRLIAQVPNWLEPPVPA
ncbi:MAG: ATP-binding protein, partial [Candidatus Limnocylindrales bacterium]